MKAYNDLLSLEEIQQNYQILKTYVAVLVAAEFVEGVFPENENTDDIKVSKASFEQWLVARKNGWRLPRPPELAVLLEQKQQQRQSQRI